MSIAAAIQITDQDTRTTSSVSGGEFLGQPATTFDGRTYRYASAGGSNLAPGKLNVNADGNADATNKTIAASAAIGATVLTVDVGGSITANVYAGGFLTINDATGEGITYAVTGNTGRTGAGEITVNLQEPVQVALTVDVSEYTLTVNSFASVVISATDQADQPVGVANVTVTAAYYFWSQTGGTCSALADEAYARGAALTIGTGVAGAFEALDAAGEPEVGTAIMAAVDTEYQPVWLSMY